ncbi:MAG TPA: DegT/DnrJ/EryC1/StrS family aminotransferase [Saprospiraceae bacterium]|jgi:dTDP-4-amino-4,6-dideoxygalactose transaminase|nr:DegT/DnrJ/EryC1/StrS family aminotransferase [Saprospiraceae bacterium]HRF38910.1 DegT/DnrJ/EryC1/StrS family aminotransferase [Saprospiraceae bacterium]HRK82255.1 DegT/DnrJ/EryC1/StrS family aminotransferase [Saprospiraceae bacterium]
MQTKFERPIQMVDLKGQYQKIKEDVDAGIREVMDNTAFIGGPAVTRFQQNLETYLGARHVITCANGTDALQIALMALNLEPGDEVIVPAFTYVATAEVIALLRLRPVMVDVDPHTFNVTAEIVEAAITPRTKAIVPVHLFGQSCDMEPIMEVAKRHKLWVVEDNAQAIGADYTFGDGSRQKTGVLGHIGCTSFYPSKNLGCYGDGGAISTNDDELAARMRMIANHGQNKRYYHAMVGVNSRLDGIQAAILDVKLRHLDSYAGARQEAADMYDAAFRNIPGLIVPARQHNSTHVFHQYTLIVENERREALQEHLQALGIPTMIYYPVPLYAQEAFKNTGDETTFLPVTDYLCRGVLSLPMHTELDQKQLEYITGGVASFFGA